MRKGRISPFAHRSFGSSRLPTWDSRWLVWKVRISSRWNVEWYLVVVASDCCSAAAWTLVLIAVASAMGSMVASTEGGCLSDCRSSSSAAGR